MPTLRAKSRRAWRRMTDEQPFEVFGAGLCFATGIPLILDGPGPGTINDTLPLFLVALWGVELCLGGFLTLVGLGTGKARVERAGLSFLAASCILYAVVLVWAAWPQALVSGGIILGFGLACLARRKSMKRTLVVLLDPKGETR